MARIVWVFPATYIPRVLTPTIRDRGPVSAGASRVHRVVGGHARGVSLAAALALPLDFPQRDLILFLTFCVIVATLVGQGLSLPWLIRASRGAGAGGQNGEEVHARLAAIEAALQRLEELEHDFPDHLPLIDQLRERVRARAEHARRTHGHGAGRGDARAARARAIRNAVLVAQREAVIGLRDAGVINDETLRSIERDLDLEALR